MTYKGYRDFKHSVNMYSPDEDFDYDVFEMNKWCNENVGLVQWGMLGTTYYFADEAAAMAFKLRWL